MIWKSSPSSAGNVIDDGMLEPRESARIVFDLPSVRRSLTLEEHRGISCTPKQGGGSVS